jgi:hypothetical protein
VVGTGSGSVNGVAFASINGAFSGTFTQGANYLLLSNVLVANGILTAMGSEQGWYSGLAGMQVVDRRNAPAPVPEPSALTLLAVALITSGYRARQP